MKKLNILIIGMILVISINGFSMHIMEGFLPIKWAGFWFLVCLPFWFLGIKKLSKISKEVLKIKWF